MQSCTAPTVPIANDITMADAEKVSAMMNDMAVEERLSPADIYEIFNDNNWCCTNVDIENNIKKGVERLRKHVEEELALINTEMKKMRKQTNSLRRLLKAKLDEKKPLRQRLALKRMKEITAACIADSPAKKQAKLTIPKTPRKRMAEIAVVAPVSQEPESSEPVVSHEPTVSLEPSAAVLEEGWDACPCRGNPNAWCTCPAKMTELLEFANNLRFQQGQEYVMDMMSACSQII